MRNAFYIAGVAIAYLIAARIGLSLAFTHGSISPVWPPTGLSLAALLLLGRSVWPGVFLGAFAANSLFTGAADASVMGIAIGNTLEALLGAWLYRRFIGPHLHFEKPAEVVSFAAIVATLSSIISATVGLLSLWLVDPSVGSRLGLLWSTWWLGDWAGAVVVTPFLLSTGQALHRRWRRKHAVEAFALVTLFIAASEMIFGGVGWMQPLPPNYPLPYLVLSFLVWAALRFDQVGVSVASGILSVVAISGTINGFGPFIGRTQDQSLLALQVFIAITTITGQILASAVRQIRRTSQAAQESAALLDTLLETAPVGLGFIDTDLRYVRINETLAAINGIPARDHIGKRMKDLIPDLADRVVPTYQSVLESGMPVVNMEIAGHTPAKPGETRYWLACYYPVRLASRVIGVGIVVVEISERKRSEVKLKKLVSDLAASNRELEQFANTASHDLQEPLRMVTNYMALVSRRYKEQSSLDSSSLDYLDQAAQGAKRMQTLIQDLLRYSRLEGSADFGPVDCDHLLKDVLSGLRLLIEENGAVVTADRLPMVYGDESLLGQVFQNLITNAIKFRGAIAPHIHIGATESEGMVSFWVEDNGIGFKMENAEIIFGIFKRLHGTGEYPGSGVGLAVCKKIVERHGGRIWAKSEPGKGSTFRFTLPVVGTTRTSLEASGTDFR